MYENVKRWRSQAPKLRERLLQARAAATKICTVRPPAIGKWPKVDDQVVKDFKARRAAGDLVRWALPCLAARARTRCASRGRGASQISRAWVQSRARKIAKALPAGDVVDFQASASWFRRCGSLAFWPPTH